MGITIIFVVFILMALGMYISTIKVESTLKKAKEVSVHSTTYNEVNCFLQHHNKNNKNKHVLIEERKVFQYRIRDNSIGIKNFQSKMAAEMIPSLHEAGHYVSINRSESYKKLYSISIKLVAFNRLVIIPLIIILLIIKSSNIEKNNLREIQSYYLHILLFIFTIASLFKLSIGIAEEYFASRKAYKYIAKKENELLDSLAKDMYIYSFLQQLFMTLTVVIGIFLFWQFTMH